MLEPSEKELGELLESARPAPPLSEGWQARAMTGMAAVAGTADRKETVPMRRLAYVIAILLVLGLAAAGVFTRSRTPNAKSLLISAAQAMEAASSVHLVLHGTSNDPNSPSGMAMMPQPAEIWVSKRAAAMRMTGPDGALLVGYGINLDTNQAWDYSAETGVLHYADLTPVADQAADIMDKAGDLYLSGTLQMLTKTVLTDVQESVTSEVRDGREVKIVTLTGVLQPAPRLIHERDVFEIDTATDHLLAMQRYLQAEGAEEQLVQSVDEVTYDVPVPTDFAPENAVREPATMSIQESDKYLSLVMSANGKEISRTDVPR